MHSDLLEVHLRQVDEKRPTRRSAISGYPEVWLWEVTQTSQRHDYPSARCLVLWWRAKQVLEFFSDLEKTWEREGQDLSPDAAKSRRIIRMKEQADRMDPVIANKPLSVLDREGELGGW